MVEVEFLVQYFATSNKFMDLDMEYLQLITPKKKALWTSWWKNIPPPNSLAKGIKLRSVEACGSSCQFAGNAEDREEYAEPPMKVQFPGLSSSTDIVRKRQETSQVKKKKKGEGQDSHLCDIETKRKCYFGSKERAWSACRSFSDDWQFYFLTW